MEDLLEGEDEPISTVPLFEPSPISVRCWLAKFPFIFSPNFAWFLVCLEHIIGHWTN
jgi:hypothetical protein